MFIVSDSKQDNIILPLQNTVQSDLLKFGCKCCIDEVISGHRPAKDLSHEMTVSMKTIGWVSAIDVSCKFGHTYLIGPKREMKRQYINTVPNKHTKTINYSHNIQVAMSAYLNGIGSTELIRFAAALCVPTKSDGIEKSFHRVSKDYLGAIMTDEANKVMKESLIEEMRLTTMLLYPATYVHLWPKLKVVTFDNAPDCDITKGITVGVSASVDMGWQKRSSGRKYDSSSGHMFLIGQLSRKVIAYKCLSVKCRLCDFATKHNIEVKDHICYKNFDGHAKAMEPSAVLQLITEIFEQSKGRLYAGTLVGDDDSSMKRHCSHSGKLKTTIPEPKWLADPSHRIKVMSKPIFALARKAKSESPVTNSDALRMKLYLAAYVRSNRDRDGITSAEMSEKIWCTLEHLFDNHELCSPTFCWKLKEKLKHQNYKQKSGNNLTNMQTDTTTPNVPIDADKDLQLSENEVSTEMETTNLRQDTVCLPIHKLRSKDGYYRDKKLHTKAYDQIKTVLTPFFEESSLQELLHSFDTQKNESLNTTVSYVAPKNRHLCSSSELSTRVGMVAACTSIGKPKFFQRIFQRCEIPETNNNMMFSLLYEHERKEEKRKREKLPIQKKIRAKTRHEKMFDYRKEEVIAKQNGTTYGEIKKKQSRPHVDTCRYSKYGCDSVNGHSTAVSKVCKFHKMYISCDEKVSKTGKFDKIVESLFNEQQAVSNLSATRIPTAVNQNVANDLSGNALADVMESQLQCAQKLNDHETSSQSSLADVFAEYTQDTSLMSSQEYTASSNYVYFMDNMPFENNSDDDEVVHI